MRPRISKKEAGFICELLEVALADLEIKNQYTKDLEITVTRLRLQIMRGAGYEVMREDFSEKKKELAKWQNRLSHLAYSNYKVTKRLLEKYRAIAEGNSHQGTYKHFNTSINDSIFKDSEGELTTILTKQLEPIDELGKRQTIKELREHDLSKNLC